MGAGTGVAAGLGEVVIRPMRPDDVEVVEQISDEAFHAVDLVHRRADEPPPSRRTPERRARWRERNDHLLRTDPGGCWVADVGGETVGVATSLVRETTWVLATYAVRPALQARGVGRPLLAAAMHHGRGCLRGMLSASADQRALRRYLDAGFELHPQMRLAGTLDRALLPVVERVRDGTPGDRDLLDSVDRGARGAARGPDHEHLSVATHLLVSDTSTGAGYVYLDDRGVAALGATNRRTATRLLWAALAASDGDVAVPHVTAANAWAVAVAHAARLEIRTEGYLAVRGMRPPAPWIHHGALL